MPLTVYGAMWCGDTRMARRVLDDKGFPYEWVDVDKDAQALAYVKEVSNGMSSIRCWCSRTAACWSSRPSPS